MTCAEKLALVATVGAQHIHNLEIEKAQLLQRIKELEYESHHVPLCGNHAEVWFTARHFKDGECWFCQLNEKNRLLKEALHQIDKSCLGGCVTREIKKIAKEALENE